MRAIAVGIHLVLPLDLSAGLIALHDIAHLGGDLLFSWDLGDEGLVDVVFGQRAQSVPTGVLVGLHVDGQLGRDLELSFEDGSWVHFSLPESLVELDGDLIRKDLDVVLCLSLQVHEELGIQLLLRILEGSLHVVLLNDIAVHEVDGDNVDANVRCPRLDGQAFD
jgi:hypothetical protein